MKQRGYGGRASQLLHGVVGQSLHDRDHAIIAIPFQAKSCDSRDCYVREVDFDEAMDVEQLKRLMAEHKDSQVGIARLLGITPDKVSKMLKGRRRLTVEEANILRTYYGLKADEKADRPHMLPVVGLVSAGCWREGFEQVMGWVPAPDRSLSRDSFVVKVEGDSMDKVVEDGGLVIVDPRDLDLISGKYYVVRNADGETTFKQYAENPARLLPCSTNERHQTILIGQEGFTVVGRVRKKVSDL